MPTMLTEIENMSYYASVKGLVLVLMIECKPNTNLYLLPTGF